MSDCKLIVILFEKFTPIDLIRLKIEKYGIKTNNGKYQKVKQFFLPALHCQLQKRSSLGERNYDSDEAAYGGK